MAADIDKLTKHLETEQRYDECLRSGNNGGLVRLINDIQTGSGNSWVDINSTDFNEIVCTEFHLTPQQESKIQTLLTQSMILTSKPELVNWLKEILSENAFNKIKEKSQIQNTWAVTAGIVLPGKTVSLSDIRKAVKKVNKSFIKITGQDKS